jgi:RNA-directed DNA polymerase
MQTKISVVAQSIIPRNINVFNDYLSKEPELESKQISDTNINNIDQAKLFLLRKSIRTLVESKAARIVAVHRVITNKGYRSKGLSQDHPATNEEYVSLVEWLKTTMRHPNKYKTLPLDRIYIPKKTKIPVNLNLFKQPSPDEDTFLLEKSLRPLSIPSIKDRCLQAVYYIGYSIYSEYMADPHSYAFRPGRSPAWAAHSLAAHLRFAFQPSWVVEIDIAKCYDRISHEFIIKNTPFIPKIILEKWLKSGYIMREFEHLGTFPTNKGIPQGGIISPVISNTVLDGAEQYLREKLQTEIIEKKITAKIAGYVQLRPDSKLFILFRFADDVIILTKSKYIAERTKELFSEFLAPRGLELSLEKTKLTDVSGNYASFPFVGYQFKKNFSNGPGKSKWFIEPPQANIDRIKSTLSQICRKKTPVNTLFYDFNIALSSWCGYYASANSKLQFKQLNRWVFDVFYFALARRIERDKKIRINRQKRKSGRKYKKKKVDKKYIYKVVNRFFLMYIDYHGKNGRMKWYYIKRPTHRKKYFFLFSPVIFRLIDQSKNKLTKMHLNYYNINDYVSITEINLNYKYGTHKRVLRKNFKEFGILTCPCCQSPFRVVGKYEFHHICPLEFGGTNKDNNIVPLCINCHQNITIAVNKRNSELCEPYLLRQLLKIPDNHLDKFYN